MPQAYDQKNYKWVMPPCYIYFYHTDEWFQLPQYPETLTDTMETQFQSQNALARTAPIFSYVNSGPRSMQISLSLHRDLMNSLNAQNSNVHYKDGDDIITSVKDDYIDILIKKMQSIALPAYNSEQHSLQPPRVAIRFGDDIFIKGVISSGGVTVTYGLPILSNNKYAKVDISFMIAEDQPYDAESVGTLGSFRGLTSGLREKMGYSSSSAPGVFTNAGININDRNNFVR